MLCAIENGTRVGAGPACVVGASAPYNHGVLLAGEVRDLRRYRGHGPLLQNSSIAHVIIVELPYEAAGLRVKHCF